MTPIRLGATLGSLVLTLLAACGTRDGSPPTTQHSPPETPTPDVAPAAPPNGRSLVRTERAYSMSGVLPDAERFVERARQRAAACYARTPSRNGALELAIQLDAAGSVTSVRAARDELGDPVVLACVHETILAMRGRPAVTPVPLPSLSVVWRFEVIDQLDPDRDCIADEECALVPQVCGMIGAARRTAADQVQATVAQQASVARCDGRMRPSPSFARCVEGTCTAVPADMDDMRACRGPRDCAVFERECGWDVIAATRRAEAESIVRPHQDGLVCEHARPPAPTPVCALGFCTLEWGPTTAP